MKENIPLFFLLPKLKWYSRRSVFQLKLSCHSKTIWLNNYALIVWFAIHTAVLMKFQILWDVIPCQLVNSVWYYGGISHSKMLAAVYQLTWLYLPEDLNLHFISYYIIAQVTEFWLVMTLNEKIPRTLLKWIGWGGILHSEKPCTNWTMIQTCNFIKLKQKCSVTLDFILCHVHNRQF